MTSHRTYRFRIALAAAVTLLTSAFTQACSALQPGTGTSASASAGATGDSQPQPQLTFEQDGETYAIVNGDVFLLGRNGQRKFVDHLFDPNFYEKNYRTTNGTVVQVDPDSGKAYPVVRTFREDFEGASSVQDLFTETRWHNDNTDQKRSGQKDNYHALGNRITLSRDVVHSGKAALKCYAVASSRSASKASISKGIMYFKKGDTVHFAGWFFIEDTPSVYDAGGFTLFDLESTFYTGTVGMRVIFRRNDSLAFELKLPKIQFGQDRGSEVSFPTGRWVKVEAQIFLSDEDGRARIWQDGKLVLDKSGRTLPLPDTIYDRFEVGISAIAQGSKYDKVVYVDDVAISASPISD